MADPVDAVDRALLAVLVADGRISMSALASRVGISRANAYARVDRLQRTGVIRGYTADVDPARLGLGVAAIILLRTEQRRWEHVRDELLTLEHLEHLAFTTGEFDFFLQVRLPDVATLRDVVLRRLNDIVGVRSTTSVIVLDETPRRTPAGPPTPRGPS